MAKLLYLMTFSVNTTLCVECVLFLCTVHISDVPSKSVLFLCTVHISDVPSGKCSVSVHSTHS